MKQIIIIGVSLVVFSGCAPKVYYWGSYENDLHAYYKSAKETEDHERYMSKLLVLIQRSETNRKPVPPGIHAEYGYALFKIGKNQDAIEYFEKEKSLWSESKPLMEKLISNVQTIMAEEENTSPASQ